MRWNFFRELGRKLVHLSFLVILGIFILIEKLSNHRFALFFMTGILLVLLFLEYLRLEFDIRIKPLEFFIRPKEINKMHGAIYFILAAIICLAVFDFKIALAALLMATFGDMVAALVGEKFGKMRFFNKKTLVGVAAELIINIIIGLIVLSGKFNFYIIMAMALAATAAETTLENIDDNLAVPLFAGFIGQILIML